MKPNNIITDLFLFFARFPQHEGIYSMFNVGTSRVPGYNELRQAVDEMEQRNLTKIKHYVFGSDFEAVRTRVNNIPAGDDYLFVDFGEIDCATDSVNRKTDALRLAATVAYRLKDFSIDLVEQSLVFSHALQTLTGIRRIMIDEQCQHPWLKNLSKKHELAPFVSPEMSSIGWTMYFSREGFDTFGVKDSRR